VVVKKKRTCRSPDVARPRMAGSPDSVSTGILRHDQAGMCLRDSLEQQAVPLQQVHLLPPEYHGESRGSGEQDGENHHAQSASARTTHGNSIPNIDSLL